MDTYELVKGEGRTRVNLLAHYLGSDLVVCIYNENAHLGAAAIGEYDHHEKRASTSVITRLGHKDDAVALKAAHLVARSTKKPVCVIAGIHLEDITDEEINKLVENATAMVEELIKSITA